MGAGGASPRTSLAPGGDGRQGRIEPAPEIPPACPYPPDAHGRPAYWPGQYLINVRIAQHGFRLHELPRACNDQWWSAKDRGELRLMAGLEAPHWAGLHDHPKRVDAMRGVGV